MRVPKKYKSNITNRCKDLIYSPDFEPYHLVKPAFSTNDVMLLCLLKGLESYEMNAGSTPSTSALKIVAAKDVIVEGIKIREAVKEVHPENTKPPASTPTVSAPPVENSKDSKSLIGLTIPANTIDKTVVYTHEGLVNVERPELPDINDDEELPSISTVFKANGYYGVRADEIRGSKTLDVSSLGQEPLNIPKQDSHSIDQTYFRNLNSFGVKDVEVLPPHYKLVGNSIIESSVFKPSRNTRPHDNWELELRQDMPENEIPLHDYYAHYNMRRWVSKVSNGVMVFYWACNSVYWVDKDGEPVKVPKGFKDKIKVEVQLNPEPEGTPLQFIHLVFAGKRDSNSDLRSWTQPASNHSRRRVEVDTSQITEEQLLARATGNSNFKNMLNG